MADAVYLTGFQQMAPRVATDPPKGFRYCLLSPPAVPISWPASSSVRWSGSRGSAPHLASERLQAVEPVTEAVQSLPEEAQLADSEAAGIWYGQRQGSLRWCSGLEATSLDLQSIAITGNCWCWPPAARFTIIAITTELYFIT